MTLYQQDKFTQAREVLEESLSVNIALGDHEAMVGVLHQLAWVAVEEDRLEEARSLCEQNITVLKEIGSPHIEMAQASLAAIL